MACLPAGNGIEEGHDSAVRDMALRFKRVVVQKGSKGGNWLAVFIAEVARNSRFGLGQSVQEFFERAGLTREGESHNRPAQNHTRRTRQRDLNPHGSVRTRGRSSLARCALPNARLRKAVLAPDQPSESDLVQPIQRRQDSELNGPGQPRDLHRTGDRATVSNLGL